MLAVKSQSLGSSGFPLAVFRVASLCEAARIVTPLHCGLRFSRFFTSVTCSGGCLGSSSGEGRSELRYAQRCAEFRELQSVERIAPRGSPRGTSGSVSCSFHSPRTSVRAGRCACHFCVSEVACWDCSGLHESRFPARIPGNWCSVVVLCAQPEVCEINFAFSLDPSSDWVTR